MKIKVATNNDVAERMKSSPEKYFVSGTPSAKELVARLLKEAVFDSSDDVSVKKLGEWWHIAATSAWFEKYSINEYFDHMLKFDIEMPPAAGSSRCGLLLKTFSNNLVAYSPKEGKIILNGRDDDGYSDEPTKCRISFTM